MLAVGFQVNFLAPPRGTHRGCRIGAALAALLTAGCGPRQSDGIGDAADTATVAAAVDSAMRAFLQAEIARDTARTLGAFLDSPEFRVYSDLQRLDYDSARAVMGRSLPALRDLTGGFDTIEVTVLGPDVALVSSPFHEALTDSAGRQTRLRGVSTWLWRRADGQWRIGYIHAAHYPETVPASGTGSSR